MSTTHNGSWSYDKKNSSHLGREWDETASRAKPLRRKGQLLAALREISFEVAPRIPCNCPAHAVLYDEDIRRHSKETIMKRVLFLAALSGALAGCGAENADKNTVVVMETSKGTVKIELFADKSPITVKNFLSYVDDKFYDGTIFHRVIKDFMIQGGGFELGLKEKERTKPPIKNESANGVSNERGTIAMARTGDPDSATAQFFINVEDNNGKREKGPNLDALQGRSGYAVFGKVIEGMDVVDKIRGVETTTKIATVQGGQKAPFKDVPEEEVVIKSIRRAEK
jgi:cyclophilin family peptidyl-prolyl cis-trans isomerase